MPGTLYVIGNGFDLHHDIESSYRRFGQYLKNVDRQTYRIVEDYLAFDDDFWSCFEARLADLDCDSVLEDAQQFFVNYSADDWRDSGHHDCARDHSEPSVAFNPDEFVAHLRT